MVYTLIGNRGLKTHQAKLDWRYLITKSGFLSVLEVFFGTILSILVFKSAAPVNYWYDVNVYSLEMFIFISSAIFTTVSFCRLVLGLNVYNRAFKNSGVNMDFTYSITATLFYIHITGIYLNEYLKFAEISKIAPSALAMGCIVCVAYFSEALIIVKLL